ncbi:uncharacterized protein METZ01_LOCUS204451 [marine metagenome]|uniref:Uncharacterized protein n=1 Tax=marine metagenome TaxID=408172 RepID=A0A382EP08_9ZZZZ
MWSEKHCGTTSSYGESEPFDYLSDYFLVPTTRPDYAAGLVNNAVLAVIRTL